VTSAEGGCPRLVGGVDGVRGGGWIMAVTGMCSESSVTVFSVWSSFTDLWSHACRKGLRAVAVDIPIGLPCGGARPSDTEARSRLKGRPGRTSSVFPAPPLCTLEADTYQDARKMAQRCREKGLTAQANALFPRIREVRGVLQPDDLQSGAGPLAAEVHPEVSFAALAGGAPMRFHKSRQAGVAERLASLVAHFPNIMEEAVRTQIPGPPAPGLDDVLDAVSAAWTARRLISGRAQRLGGCAKDETNYPMSIWV